MCGPVYCHVLVLFGGAGALAYLTFGPNVQTVVLVNLDAENKFVQAVCAITLLFLHIPTLLA